MGTAQARRDALNADIGKQAEKTKTLIFEALAKILESTPWHAVSVAAVMRETEFGTSTFYQYFTSLPEAIEALAEYLREEKQPVPEHLQRIISLLVWERELLTTNA